MAEYESRKVKDMDMQQARDEYLAIRGETDDLQDVFTRKPKCLQRKPDYALIGTLIDAIVAEGSARGDCGGCGKEDIHLYLDNCHICTIDEIYEAEANDMVGPLKEKYGI